MNTILLLLFISSQGPHSCPFFQLEYLSLSSFPYGVNRQIFDFVCQVSPPWLSQCRLSCYCRDTVSSLVFSFPSPSFSIFFVYTESKKKILAFFCPLQSENEKHHIHLSVVCQTALGGLIKYMLLGIKCSEHHEAVLHSCKCAYGHYYCCSLLQTESFEAMLLVSLCR